MINFVKNLLITLVVVIGIGYILNFVTPQNVSNNQTPARESEQTQSPRERTITNDTEILEEEDLKERNIIETLGQTDEVAVSSETLDMLDDFVERIMPVIESVVSEVVEDTISFNDINTSAREALVNIVCTSKSGGLLNPSSGSGVIIDPRGIILTNAHVAQYYLLRNYITPDFIECVIRTGSPASPAYFAEPLYISEAWVTANANNLNESNPTGTGEHDYALLVITESAREGVDLPETFPFVPVTSSAELSIGDSVFIGGYPAGFLSGITVQKDLNITSTIGQISDLFTFNLGTLDLITVDGSILSQKGASGGAVIDDKGDVVGLVVTSTQAESTADRQLGAITTSHINISMLQQTGDNIGGFLSGDLKQKVQVFNTETAPALEQLLFEVLDK